MNVIREVTCSGTMSEENTMSAGHDKIASP